MLIKLHKVAQKYLHHLKSECSCLIMVHKCENNFAYFHLINWCGSDFYKVYEIISDLLFCHLKPWLGI